MSVKDYLKRKYNLDGEAAKPELGLDLPEPKQFTDDAQAEEIESTPKEPTLQESYKAIASDDSGINAAKDSAGNKKMWTGIIEGLSTAFAGGKNTDGGFYDGLRKDADRDVDAARVDKQNKLQAFLKARELAGQAKQETRADEKYNTDKDLQTRLQDPTSQDSKIAQNLADKMFPGKDWTQLTAAQWKSFGPNFEALFNAQERNTDRALAQNSIAQTRADDLVRKTGNDLDRKVTTYSTTLEKTGIPAATQTAQEVLALLPPEGKDVPGYGPVVGAVPDLFISKEGQDVRRAASTLFNITLKDRSGAAVTDQELQRLKNEFGSGTWKTDRQFREGIAQYVRRLNEVSRNIMAGTNPEALQEYKARGGSDFLGVLDGMVKTSSSQKAPAAKDPPALTDDERRELEQLEKELGNKKAPKRALIISTEKETAGGVTG